MDFHIAMQLIKAEEQGEFAIAASVPSMTKEGRNKFFKRLNKSAQLVNKSKDDKIMSTQEAALALARTMKNG
jgi:serine phosphatase RsbU (regulator of sigma subunit)